jgi:hypothetical protein
MNIPLDFLTYTQWSGIATLAVGVLAILAFLFGWGFRFRLVGITGFLIVLTVGLFGLNLGLSAREQIPDAVQFTRVFDNGGNQVVILVPETITEKQLNATLRQAAINYYSLGRTGSGSDDRLTIRARALTHPKPGLTRPLYLGQIKRSLTDRADQAFEVEISPKALAELQRSQAQSSKS